MSDGMSEDEERLVIYSQPKGDSDDNKIHVHIEHANKIEVVIPLKRESHLPPLLSNDRRERSVLEGSRIG